LISETSEQAAKLAELDRQRGQKEAERATIAAGIAKLQAVVPVIQERVDVRKTLLEKALTSKLLYLTDYQDLVSMQQDILVQQNKLRESDAAIAALRETRDRTEAEYRSDIFTELTKAQQRAAGLAQDEVKAERQTKLQVLKAPVDGVVQQLAVHTVGGVVTPAEALAVVVPDDSAIEIEAMLSNRDVGFVHAGQEADIKVDTFNFTRYGLIRGAVASVSPDAVAQAASESESRDSLRPSSTVGAGPKDQELNYVARISLGRTAMRVDERMVRLIPGMEATVEIKTGSRKIISYLLSPIEKYKHEALRER
jgi:membrane fusion protein, hemolysin D